VKLAEGEQAWCLGVAAQEIRALEPADRAWLMETTSATRRAMRIWAIVVRGTVSLMVVGAGFWLWSARDEGKLGRSLAIYLICVVPAIGGLVGALVEVIVGWSKAARLAFGLTLSMVIVGSIGGSKGPLFPLAMMAGLFIYLVGLLALILRWREHKKQCRLLPRVEADLRRDEALVFAGVPDSQAECPPELKKRGLLAALDTEVAFCVLPLSAIVLPSASLAIDAWVPVDVVRTAASRANAITAPIPGMSKFPPDPNFELAQRHLSGAEADEIERHRKQLLRRAGLVFIAIAYFGARVAQLGEFAMRKSHHGELSGAGWFIACVAGLYFASGPLRLRGSLGKALRVRKVFALRPRDAESDSPPLEEVLAGTTILWSQEGKPMKWRTRKL
jgi:hypothetical protein